MPDSLILKIFNERLGDRAGEFLIPPPCFTSMRGEFVAFDQGAGALKTRFPVSEGSLNVFGSMQGGMIAAAVDNTIGPLSMLVAPPNVTRRLEMKYSRPVTPDLEYLFVEARLLENEGRRLVFSAEARDRNSKLLARARAWHYIVE